MNAGRKILGPAKVRNLTAAPGIVLPASGKKESVLKVFMKEDETEDAAMARNAANPSSNATITSAKFNPLCFLDGRMDLSALQAELDRQANLIRDGNMERPEAMLVAQAHTLDALFNALAQRASFSLCPSSLHIGEIYLRLALKAQSQCRSTLEALAEIKNPASPTFVKQQNLGSNGGCAEFCVNGVSFKPASSVLQTES